MTDKDFNKVVEFYNAGGGLLPVNEKAHELLDQSDSGEILTFLEVTQRDLKFHRCYMSLLKFIYGYMPKKFRDAVKEKNFYVWLKHLKGSYDVLFEFEDGTVMIEYESIAFGRMSQKAFEDYIREQLPWIYENVIKEYFPDPIIHNGMIETIEEEYKKFLAKL